MTHTGPQRKPSAGTLLEPAAAAALLDWRSLTRRAHALDPSAAMRLTVVGSVLALTVSPLHPKALAEPMPLVLGMRTLRLSGDGADGVDAVVETAALLDRFARAEAGSSAAIPVPPAEVRAPWAGVAPPRGPWTPVGEVPVAVLAEAASSGIAEVAEGTPPGAGSAAVDGLRRRVWSRPITAADDAGDGAAGSPLTSRIPAGAAFAAEVLGFLPSADSAAAQTPAQVFASGAWMRLTTAGGHVLTKSVS